jgi:hypothetical protein
VTRSDDAPTSALLDRLKSGESAARVRQALGLGPAEYLSALGRAALGSDEPTDWPGLIQGAPRRPWLAAVLEEMAWAEAFPRSTRPARLAVSAGLLQVHDFWDASHNAAQQADDLGERGSAAYWHAIAHRREPDPGNAAYWFRRVGPSPLFPTLASNARSLLETLGSRSPVPPLVTNDTWNPFAFIDLCTSARPGSDHAALALRLQRLEMTALLETCIHAL